MRHETPRNGRRRGALLRTARTRAVSAPAAPPDADARASWRGGLRAGVPFALAAFLVSVSFGVLAREAGLSAAATIAMSVIVFAGSAQFAAISILAAGGGV